jgi:hypothetical protein
MTTHSVSHNDVIMLLKICTCPNRHLPRHEANLEERFSQPLGYYFHVRTETSSCSLSLIDALYDALPDVMDNLCHVSMDVHWLPTASSMTLSMHMFIAWRHTVITQNVGCNVHANNAIIYALNIDIYSTCDNVKLDIQIVNTNILANTPKPQRVSAWTHMCCSGHQNEHTVKPQTTQNFANMASHVIAPTQST